MNTKRDMLLMENALTKLDTISGEQINYANGAYSFSSIGSSANRQHTQLFYITGDVKITLANYDDYRFDVFKYPLGELRDGTHPGWQTADYKTYIESNSMIGITLSRVDNANMTAEDIVAAGLEITANDTAYQITASYADVTKIKDELKSGLQNSENPLRFKRYYDHLFIDMYSSPNQVIPNQSLFNVDMSRRLGFNVIEANLHKLSDDNYLVIHGVSGKFGPQVEHVDGTTDISDIKIGSVTLAWVKENVRYRSLYEKYRVAPPSIEEFMSACKENNLIPFATCTSEEMATRLNELMGKDNYIAYNGQRAWTDAIISTYTGKTTKQEILDHCNSYGQPFMYCMSNPTTFDDETLRDIVDAVHKEGYLISFAGCYLSEQENQRLMSMGFDASASAWQIPDIDSGNICNLVAGLDFNDFTHTGTDSDGVLELAAGQKIESGDLAKVFLGAANLDIRYSGEIKLTLGHKIVNKVFTSDGTDGQRFSTYFIDAKPTFAIEAVQPTTIISIEYKASKV